MSEKVITSEVVIDRPKDSEKITEVSSLSVNLTDRSMSAMQEQRKNLDSFVRSQLKEGINGDFAKIPGTPKPSLLKPGAEKLANLFKLGSRIASKEKHIDRESGFAMFTYTVEIFHIPTGAVIAQCEGSANSDEKKNKNKSFADQLNSLGKMAQKRAFVGGVIMAVGASDFFSSDMDDTNFGNQGQEKANKIQGAVVKPNEGTRVCDVCGSELIRTKTNNAWYCRNFGDKALGEHTYIKD